MNPDRATLDAWTAKRRRHGGGNGRYLVRLCDGESLPAHTGTGRIVGPTLVELIVYRDGNWSTSEVGHLTPASIMLEVGTVV